MFASATARYAYWPNLGYGRFGPKITMDRAPWFDAPDLFDQRRLRLADIDGSGTADLIYLGGDGTVRLWFNLSGNSWTTADSLRLLSAIAQCGFDHRHGPAGRRNRLPGLVLARYPVTPGLGCGTST